MPADIQPLTPVSSSPLVRDKRHYHGEEKQQQKKKQEEETSDETLVTAEDDTASQQQSEMDIDEKNDSVKHIDEYA